MPPFLLKNLWVMQIYCKDKKKFNFFKFNEIMPRKWKYFEKTTLIKCKYPLSLIYLKKKRDKNVSHTWLLFCKRKKSVEQFKSLFLNSETKDNPLHVIKFDFCQNRGHFAIFGDHVMNISNNKWALSHTLRIIFKNKVLPSLMTPLILN